MIRFALKSLTTRKLRTALTALAIVLGVAMMSGSYVLTDTIDKAFDAIFVDSYAGTDAVVTGKDPGFGFEGESAQAPPIPEDTLERVRAVDGVEVAAGSVTEPVATSTPSTPRTCSSTSSGIGGACDCSPSKLMSAPLPVTTASVPA